ncbi:hypothetical protein MBLNU230_g2538t1 [Neophaeotheca triangularis]
MLHRFSRLIFVTGIAILLALFVLFSVSLDNLPQKVGLGEKYGPSEEQIQSGKNILPDLRVGKPDPDKPFKNSHNQGNRKADSGLGDGKAQKRPPGQTKPLGSNYTKTLVMPRLSNEDTSWVEAELQDMLDSGALSTAIYTVDRPEEPFKVPKNKGHEVMVYLSYIIHFYEELPDVSIFMHSHRFAWHNNEILETDASLMIRHLSPERVTREGYMNLRCHWDPGCPDWLHPGNTVRNPDKQEEVLIGESWAELFPFDLAPSVLAQPCCAQFAVSRERIQAIHKSRYMFMRDWLIRVEYSDYLSGRIFEYLWQFIFSGDPVHCPSMSACYCDGYGLCFGSEEAFDYWFELKYVRDRAKEELRLWLQGAHAIEDQIKKHGQVAEEAVMDVPEVGKDEVLEKRIAELDEQMNDMIREAIEKGRDPRQRAKESGREWKEGDGF